ncbi:MAG: SDR family oxidoreductase [Solirubrobacterales bacterium]
MRVFVTGASGWIGAPTVKELVAAGHQVVGLARSDASAAKIEAAGGTVRRGDLDGLDGLRAAATAADAVVHLAFKHEVAFLQGDFAAAAEADRAAIEAIGEALVGTDKAFVIASGTGAAAPGRVATENDGHAASPAITGGFDLRRQNAEWTLGLAGRGVRSSVLRLAPTNHGDGDNGFTRHLVDTARAKGVSAYVGDGANRWAAAHRLDTAALARIAVEGAPAGSTLHAVAEEGVELRAIAAAIGARLGVPVESIAPEAATEHFGFLGTMVALDIPASSALTRELTGWEPTRQGLIADLEEDHYYAVAIG